MSDRNGRFGLGYKLVVILITIGAVGGLQRAGAPEWFLWAAVSAGLLMVVGPGLITLLTTTAATMRSGSSNTGGAGFGAQLGTFIRISLFVGALLLALFFWGDYRDPVAAWLATSDLGQLLGVEVEWMEQWLWAFALSIFAILFGLLLPRWMGTVINVVIAGLGIAFIVHSLYAFQSARDTRLTCLKPELIQQRGHIPAQGITMTVCAGEGAIDVFVPYTKRLMVSIAPSQLASHPQLERYQVNDFVHLETPRDLRGRGGVPGGYRLHPLPQQGFRNSGLDTIDLVLRRSPT